MAALTVGVLSSFVWNQIWILTIIIFNRVLFSLESWDGRQVFVILFPPPFPSRPPLPYYLMPCLEPSALILLMTHFMSFISTLCHLITTVNILCGPRTLTLHVHPRRKDYKQVPCLMWMQTSVSLASEGSPFVFIHDLFWTQCTCTHCQVSCAYIQCIVQD